MGALDKRQKRYFEDPKRFADTWNALAFNGFEFIHWAELSEGNPVLTHVDTVQTLERISDVVMKTWEKTMTNRETERRGESCARRWMI